MTPAEIRTNKSALRDGMAATSKLSSSFITVLDENDGVPGSKFEREPENYTVEQLKHWLKCRNLAVNEAI